MARWLQIELEVPLDCAELGGAALLGLGAEGYETRDGETLQRAGANEVRLVTYLAEAAGSPDTLRADLLGQLGAWLPEVLAAGALRLGIQPVDDPGWAEAWKAFFHPVEVGEKLLVRPPWEAVPAGSTRAVLTLDPGLAFGTGTHPTTRLCLEELELAPPPRLLDVGCGSGILAIAAALLGSESCLGIDNDPEALTVAVENAQRNGVEDRCNFPPLDLSEVEGEFPYVVANIISGVLLHLRDALRARVAPGGRLLLSGILAPEANRVEEAFVAAGLRALRRREMAEADGDRWCSLLFAAPDPDARA